MKLKILSLLFSFARAGVPGDGFVESQEDLQAKLNYNPIVFDDVKYDEFYLEEMIPSIHDASLTNEEINEQNTKWLEEISEEQETFMNSMINTWKTVPLQAAMIRGIVEHSESCWAILVYNSNDAESHEGMRSLLFAMSKHLYERTAVGSLDLAYPANAAMFHHIFPNPLKDTPAILIRAPNAMNSMVRSPLPQRDVNDDSYFLLDEVKYFGEIISRKKLVKDLPKCLKHIMEIYEEMPGNIKVTTIFMEHYNERGKAYIMNFIKQYIEEISLEIQDQLENQGLLPVEELPEKKLEEMTKSDISKYQAIYLREMTKGMQIIYSQETLFKKRLEKNIQDDHDGKGIVEGKRPNFHPKVRRSIEPLKQIPADPFLDEWNEYAQKQQKKYKNEL